jgi:hypothetical protein
VRLTVRENGIDETFISIEPFMTFVQLRDNGNDVHDFAVGNLRHSIP